MPRSRNEDVPLRRLIPLGGALVLVLLLVGSAIGTPAARAASPGILITEVQAANTSTVTDDRGGYSDWIELHNPTATPISLLGYTLTDDPDEPDKWSLPAATLAPGDFRVVWTSGVDQVTPEGWHTSFRLSRGGEYVGLFGPNGVLVDAVAFGAQETDVSLGRLGAESDQWVSFPNPTPGAANTTWHRLQTPLDAPPVVVTPGSGRFAGPVMVQLHTPVPGSLLYYALDGADPTVDGQEYTAPLELEATTVLRAVALDKGVPVSAVTTATYLVAESTSLPVLSLVTDPAHLWDETAGIHVNAEGRGREWERPVTVEWLSPTGEVGFSVGAGLRIHGNISRLRVPKRSFRLYFRGEYGPRELAYPLFGAVPGQTYDRLVLRAGVDDGWLWPCEDKPGCYREYAVFLRDQLVRDLHMAMGQVAPQGRWVALYLNGVYWGLYNLTERVDDTFLVTHFDASTWYAHSKSGELTPGSAGRWYRFADWLASADLRSAAQYEQAVQYFDIENFTGYYLLNIWARNTDWPHNNWIVARAREGPDTRWRFIVWDAESTFERDEDTFERVVLDKGRLGKMLASLLQNAQYRTYFATQVERHLAGALDTASVRERLDTLAAELRPEMAAEAARWLPEHETAVLAAQWETELQRISDTFEADAQRLRQLTDPQILQQHLPQFAAPEASAPAPVVPPTGPPGVRINEILAANTHTAFDDRGAYTGWLELHNPTDTPMTILGYSLTDDPTQPTKWPVPVTTLKPGGGRVIWTSGVDQVTGNGWHASFRLDRAGGYVGLFGPDGRVVDAVTFDEQEADVSLGRLPESDRWVAFPAPTLGAANTTPHRLRAAPGAPAVVVTPGSGFYAGPVIVHLEAPLPDGTLYFTLDGSDPTVGGEVYTAPLELEETTVLRTVALRDGVPVSAVTTATYLVGASTGLPVVSLVTDPSHLWDEATGIYTNASAWADWGRSWGRASERPVTVQRLSPEGELDFSVGAGLRVRGGENRSESAKRSFELYFRAEYGPRELAYPLFGLQPGQTYDRLILRAEDQDSWQCSEASQCAAEAVYVPDQLVRELHEAMGQEAVQGRWVALYLNGSYWGLYNLTEYVDESFLVTHFDASEWYTHSAGSSHRWHLFVDWLREADLSVPAQYERVVQQLDIESFTSFIILRLWAGDTAWGSHNWYAARMRSGPDTRWRLFLWDADVPPGVYGLLSREAVKGREARGSLIPILTSLLQNTQYQAYFKAEVERHLTGALATASVRECLDALAAELRPSMAAEAARWWPEQAPAAAVAQWEAALQRFAASLDANAQRLRDLSDPETLQQQLPQLAAAATLAPLPPLPPDTRVALLVDQPAALTEGDAAVVAHLEARGAKVTVLGTGDGSTADPAAVAASHDLLLISSNIQDLDAAARYAQTATPLIFWEPLRLLEATQLARWGGTRPEQIYIRIVDAAHPITAGLPVDERLRVVRRPDTFSVAWPFRGPGVQVLAKHLFGNDSALLVAEVGAELANGQPAPARMVFWFGHHDTFYLSTGEAIRLFDRAVDWALGLLPEVDA